MPKNTTLHCPRGQATKLTDSAVSAARVAGYGDFKLLATPTDVAPTTDLGGFPMLAYTVLGADYALEDLFPGVGSSVYLWAWPEGGAVSVAISHA